MKGCALIWLQICHERKGSALHLPPYLLHMNCSVTHRLPQSVSNLPDWIGGHLKKGMGARIGSPVYTFALCCPAEVHMSNAPVLSSPPPPALPLSSFSVCVVLQMRLSALWGKAPLGGWCSVLTTAGVCHFTLKKQQLSASGVLFPRPPAGNSCSLCLICRNKCALCLASQGLDLNQMRWG